ncbi:MAG: alanine--tRNA ligase [Alphaproteobacteria bacterium]|nr:alanine--tRNA ligase [Alphaproteobacteria bacterium]
MPSLNEIRSTFLDFFRARGHDVVPSASLVPADDPTLLFVNAGMVPFKNVFTGAEKRPYSRAASSQKCVRAGGKHNDLDNVGYTARHHTFFEMLGNFSFGDYFKEEAIDAAWRLVTKEYGLAPDRLTVTVYHTDDEAAALWARIAGLPDERIIRIATSDNFWSMGDTGPCGPCSEIFYDHGPSVPGGPPGSPDEDGDRFIEIWNLVFMQFERLEGGEERNLPKPSIDTGMGLERIAAVLQGVHSNYEVDLFRTLIAASEEISGAKATGENAAAHRVVADHLRATAFLIADGVQPSNEGRGYVLRRIMRRAMRYANGLNPKTPLMSRLVPALAAEMGVAYPDLRRGADVIAATIAAEEERFADLLGRGLRLLQEETAKLPGGAPLPGEAAFRLYDTFGFPIDLTQDALRREGRGVDIEGFERAMNAQRETARAAWSGSGDAGDEAIWNETRAELGDTTFTGYDRDTDEATLRAIVVDGARVDVAPPGAKAHLVFDRTPFYAESGGQQGDAGAVRANGAEVFRVADVKKRAGGGLHVHVGVVGDRGLKVGETYRLEVDAIRRDRTRANHSATHLAHKALREVLGSGVRQMGSFVGDERLRFDFSHDAPMSAGEIAEVERRVNAVVRQNAPVETKLMTYDDAVASGAIALFGEKYDDEVRVLTMGAAIEGDAEAYSVELCGGTHVRRLGDIALFKIVAEGGVSSGVRRIEALTGEAARLYLEEQADIAKRASAALKTVPGDLAARIDALVAERRKLDRELAEAKKKLALGGGGTSADPTIDVGGVKFIGKVVTDVAAKDLRGLVDQAKSTLGSGVAAFISVNEGKAALTVGVTDDLKDRLSAVDLARAGSAAIGGKGGGGRPDMAQAGGPDGANAEAAIGAIKAAIDAGAAA